MAANTVFHPTLLIELRRFRVLWGVALRDTLVFLWRSAAGIRALSGHDTLQLRQAKSIDSVMLARSETRQIVDSETPKVRAMRPCNIQCLRNSTMSNVLPVSMVLGKRMDWEKASA